MNDDEPEADRAADELEPAAPAAASAPGERPERWIMTSLLLFVGCDFLFCLLATPVDFLLDVFRLSGVGPGQAPPSVELKREAPAPAPPIMKFPNTCFKPTAACPIILTPAGEPDPAFKLPRVRLYTGEDWYKEETDIALGTDGKHLTGSIFLWDAHPEDMVTEYTRGPGDKDPWKDDGVELFLCAGPEAVNYYQFMISNTGVWRFSVVKNEWGLGTMPYTEWQHVPTVECEVRKTAQGCAMHWRLRLADMDMPELREGDGIYMQIVRNYRGQMEVRSELLQLFPFQVYVDNSGMSNHHRKAFHKVHVATPETAAREVATGIPAEAEAPPPARPLNSGMAPGDTGRPAPAGPTKPGTKKKPNVKTTIGSKSVTGGVTASDGKKVEHPVPGRGSGEFGPLKDE